DRLNLCVSPLVLWQVPPHPEPAMTAAAARHRLLALGFACLIATSAPALAAPEAKPVAGQQVRFPQGIWAGVPQAGPDGKVRQCVLVAPRQRAGKDGPVNTRF